MRLLATAIHELSHALMCWLTCGRVQKVEVYENEAGVTHYAGGVRWLIASAGYLGEAFWGAVFVVAAGGRRTATVAATGLVLALLTASLCYRPNRVLVLLTIFYVMLTLSFVWMEWCYVSPILMYLILLFGIFVGTYAVVDIFQHLIIHSRPGSDSYALYEESGRCCVPRCIGVTWLLVAIALQLAGAWLALILMSEECEDLGWFECVFHSKLDLEMKEFDWWPDNWEFDFK